MQLVIDEALGYNEWHFYFLSGTYHTGMSYNWQYLRFNDILWVKQPGKTFVLLSQVLKAEKEAAMPRTGERGFQTRGLACTKSQRQKEARRPWGMEWRPVWQEWGGMSQKCLEVCARSFRGLKAVMRSLGLNRRVTQTAFYGISNRWHFENGNEKSRLFVYGARLESGNLGRRQF